MRVQSTERTRTVAHEPLAELARTWKGLLRVVGWVRWPQQAIVRATVQRLFARWYVNNFLEWRWRHGVNAALCVRRSLIKKDAVAPTVALRPLTSLEDKLALIDGLVAICLATRAASDTGEPAAPWLAGSTMACSYLVVWLGEAIGSWGRTRRRARPVRGLFGASGHEQRLAAHAHRLATQKLEQRVVAVDRRSLLALGWRLGLGASCLDLARRTEDEDAGPRTQANIALAWAVLAALLKFGSGDNE